MAISGKGKEVIIMVNCLFSSMRPVQWYKNTLLFMGLVFSGNLLNYSMWLSAIFSFVVFCLLSSSVYIMNDIFDVRFDKRHPLKSKRPIASGRLQKISALIFSLLLTIFALAVAYWLGLIFFVACVLFLVLNFLYSWKLKRVMMLDLLIIGVDFVIRTIAGCLVIGAPISAWVTVCAFFLALVLVIGKRRNENTNGYTQQMCDMAICVCLGVLIVSYSLYTFHTGNLWMLVTIPVVVYGLFRYLWIVQSYNAGGDMVRVLKDKGILASIVVWVGSCVTILYLKG